LQGPLWHLLDVLPVCRQLLCCPLHLLFPAAVLVLIVSLRLLLSELLPPAMMTVPVVITIVTTPMNLRITARIIVLTVALIQMVLMPRVLRPLQLPFSLDHLLDLSRSTVSLLHTLLLFPIIVF